MLFCENAIKQNIANVKIFITASAIFLFALIATAQTTEVEGRNLAQQLADAKPTEGLTNTGVLQIRNANEATNIPVKFKMLAGETNWQNIYIATFEQYDTNNLFGWKGEIARVVHSAGQINKYQIDEEFFDGRREIVDGKTNSTVGPLNGDKIKNLSVSETSIPFAHSDFWICDLGLEFFHWPEQKIIKKEFARGRGCMVLESTNPNPSPNSYSR